MGSKDLKKVMPLSKACQEKCEKKNYNIFVARCRICGRDDPKISKFLGLCRACVLEREEAKEIIKRAHEISRRKFNLSVDVPQSGRRRCRECLNECSVGDEGGYCGIKERYSFRYGSLQFYHDPLPTNCVADWVCAGGAGSGYPVYSYREGPEYGFKNLAVFFCACSFNCLYCQNWHFKIETRKNVGVSDLDLLDAVDDRTSCVCFFGGDPSCQMPFAIHFSKLVRKKKEGKILRICFETNGTMNRGLLDRAFQLSLESGGCIKFDLKAYDPMIHLALTGKTNKRTLENFEHIARKFDLRPDPPPVVASTLIVPGYVEEEEVSKIAGFISQINPDIPYAILAYYPHFMMDDLPLVKKEVALRCLDAALGKGLRRVRLGNTHLLI